MPIPVPSPDRLPRTANLYTWQGKPAAVIPGRCGVIYDPAPQAVSWTELVRDGTPVSEHQFWTLLHAQE